MSRRVSDLIEFPAHEGGLEGACSTGAAELGGIVRIALWLDGAGRVRRARFRATSCPALVAYSEAACALAEAAAIDRAPSVDQIRAAVAGVHPVHQPRADAVALAFTRALRTGQPPEAEQEPA